MEKTLNDLFEEIIIDNECGGNIKVSLEFSDPDGVRSGKSGWSFGPCQFDTKNNTAALYCLRACGFTEDEISGIVDQTIDVRPLDARLAAHADIINSWSEKQLSHCLDAAGNFASDRGIPLADSGAMLMLADTINQYGSLGDGSAHHLLDLSRPVTAQDILDMKLTWKYATASKNGHDDTIRRYDNVMKVVKEGI